MLWLQMSFICRGDHVKGKRWFANTRKTPGLYGIRAAVHLVNVDFLKPKILDLVVTKLSN
jgi:hypothetical protein